KDFYQYNYNVRSNHLSELSFEYEFGTLPYRNSIRNLEVVRKSTSIKALKDLYKGCTALVVGAGPSLELDIPQIKENYDRLFIIAAGSSIQSLLYYGIKPHLIVSIDPAEINGKVFENVDTSNVPLVYVPQIY